MLSSRRKECCNSAWKRSTSRPITARQAPSNTQLVMVRSKCPAHNAAAWKPTINSARWRARVCLAQSSTR